MTEAKSVDWLKRHSVMTFFTPAGQVLPGDTKADPIVEARFSAIPGNMTEWLKNHSATVEYHAARIEVSADVRVGKFVTSISGMHRDSESAAIEQLMKRSKKATNDLKRNRYRLEEQTQVKLIDHVNALRG